MVRIAICDDNRGEAEQLRMLLADYQEKHPEQGIPVKVFSSAEDLLQYLEENAEFDIYLLDIIMPGVDGITAARTLRRRGDGGIIIYLTSSRDYALDAYQVRAMQYLLKPPGREELFATIDQAVAMLHRKMPRRFPVHTADGVVQLRLSDLSYVECIRHVLCFHRADGQVLTSRSIRVPFTDAVAPLLEDRRFLHAHKSFILNMTHVEQLRQDAFRMINGDQIPVPRNKFAAVRSAYFDFLSNRTSDGEGVC